MWIIGSWGKRRLTASKPAASDPHPEERALARVSKDEAHGGLMVRDGALRLLTMRGETGICRAGPENDTRIAIAAAKGGRDGTAGHDRGLDPVPRRSHADDTARLARAMRRRDGGGWLQDRLCRCVVPGDRADRLGFCALSRRRHDPGVVAADLPEASQCRADAARGDSGRGVVSPRPHLYGGEAPDAGRRQA